MCNQFALIIHILISERENCNKQGYKYLFCGGAKDFCASLLVAQCSTLTWHNRCMTETLWQLQKLDREKHSALDYQPCFTYVPFASNANVVILRSSLFWPQPESWRVRSKKNCRRLQRHVASESNQCMVEFHEQIRSATFVTVCFLTGSPPMLNAYV